MAKGYFTQGMAVLLKAPIAIDELKPYLEGFTIMGSREPSKSWQMAGPSLLLEYRPEVDGCVQIDVVDQPWPDSMGGSNEDPALFAAWGAGAFGPFCFPGSLTRACQHCYNWKEGPEVVRGHTAFLRLRLTYDLDGDINAPEQPRDMRAAEECELLQGVAEALLEHPSALCYFNPNGEVLASLPSLAEICDHYRQASSPAVNLLTNRRAAKIEDSDWLVMDTVGMSQLDLMDLEVCFTDKYDPNEVAVFLVKTALQLTRPGAKLKDGHTITGPAGVLFEAKQFAEPLMVPPRRVVRLRPRDGTVSPPVVGFGDKPFGKGAWWQFWKM